MKRVIAVSVVCATIFIILWIFKIFEITKNMLILGLIGAGLFLIGAAILKIITPRIRTGRFFALKQMSFLEWQLTFCLCIILICGSFLLNYLTSMLYGLLAINAPAAFSDAGYPSVLTAILCIAVLPAIFEEIFFRGAVLTVLRSSKMKDIAVIGASAVLFAVLHGPGYYFLTDLYAGILLGVLVYLTGSVYAAMTAHFLANFISYFLTLYGAKLTEAGIGDLTVHVVVVCLIGAVCHLLHLLKKLILKNDEEDRSRINENSRRWEEKRSKGENNRVKTR